MSATPLPQSNRPAKQSGRRGLLPKIAALPRIWWSHRISLAISLAVTVVGLLVYKHAFLRETPPTLLAFAERLELSAIDTRFRYRGQNHANVDPRIVIVGIDQASQEVLGHWPFSRTHFAHMLDALREDGAKVVAFDITFSQPDPVGQPVIEMRDEVAKLRRGGAHLDPRLDSKLTELLVKYSPDEEFAHSIETFGSVVLGNYFLYSQSDLTGITAATLDSYAELIRDFPFPRVEPLRPQLYKQDFATLVDNYSHGGFVPEGAEANLEMFSKALPGDKGATGFFNFPPDTDGVVRHALLALPYGRSKNLEEWDLYASLDVQTVRRFLDVPNDQTTLQFGPVGVARVQVSHDLPLQPDPLARSMINYRGPVRTYPYLSVADVALKNFPPGTFRGKIVLVGATATGIGDVRPTPYGNLNFPGVEIHANVIDNMLHQDFLQRGARQSVWDISFVFLFGFPLGLWLAASRPQNMWFALFLAIPFVIGVYQAFLKGWWLNLT